MKIISVLFFTIVFAQLSAQQPELLVGKISVSDLKTGIYSQWFINQYEAFSVDKTKLDSLKPLLDSVNITIFMGTWCSDSQREIPRFFKLLDALDYPSDKVTLVAVDRQKTTPNNFEDDLNIERVPTFIFYNEASHSNSTELGRIVEYPIASLEEDMFKILSGKPYRHAYAQ